MKYEKNIKLPHLSLENLWFICTMNVQCRNPDVLNSGSRSGLPCPEGTVPVYPGNELAVV